MKIKLNSTELCELSRLDSKSGGFQNFMRQLWYRVEPDSDQLDLDDEDLSKIHRYAFDYKDGGWQGRLKKIFSRTLGADLSGKA